MKSIKHIILTILALLFSLTPLPTLATAPADLDEPTEPPPPTVEDITSKSAIVIDFETGLEIYAYNADERRPPASMTKAMAVYIVYEAIANGAITLDTPVPISEKAFDLANDREYTNVRLAEDEIYTVDELLDAVIIVSACGATVALAELVGGSVDEFLDMMNAKAEEWGVDALFFNVYGGTDEKLETRVSARSMATIVRNTILEFPEVLEKTAKRNLQFGERAYRNTNGLLGQYEGLDGYKTGYTRAAGACFAGTAEREEIRLITVVMGAENNAGRFGDTAILLDHGFENLEEVRALAATSDPDAENDPDLDEDSGSDPTTEPTAPSDPATLAPLPTPIVVDTPQDESPPEDDLSEDDPPGGGGFWFFIFIIAVIAAMVFITLMATVFRR